MFSGQNLILKKLFDIGIQALPQEWIQPFLSDEGQSSNIHHRDSEVGSIKSKMFRILVNIGTYYQYNSSLNENCKSILGILTEWFHGNQLHLDSQKTSLKKFHNYERNVSIYLND